MTKPKTKELPKTKTTTEKRFLKCQLTKEELLQAGEDLATELDNLGQLGTEIESIKKSLKSKEAELDAKIHAKQIIVRNKYEYRQVDCDNILDYEVLECYVIRSDTGEEINRRKMTEDEKQTTLPFDGDSA